MVTHGNLFPNQSMGAMRLEYLISGLGGQVDALQEQQAFVQETSIPADSKSRINEVAALEKVARELKSVTDDLGRDFGHVSVSVVE